jgi:hypothetical protein
MQALFAGACKNAPTPQPPAHFPTLPSVICQLHMRRCTSFGVERPLSFGAFIGQPFEENKLLARAHFDIDRTEWGVLYGPGKFYEKMGKHLVDDYISLDLKIVAV